MLGEIIELLIIGWVVYSIFKGIKSEIENPSIFKKSEPRNPDAPPYTIDAYTRDCYIRDHGHGHSQTMAMIRCRHYEKGRNPYMYLSEDDWD